MNGHPHLIMVAEIPSSRNRAREARRTHSNTSPVMPMSPVALGVRPGGTLGLRRTLAIPPTSVSMARAQVRARCVRHRGAASHHYQDQHHPDRFGQPHPRAVVSSVSRWKVSQPPAPPVDARCAAACDIPTTRPRVPANRFPSVRSIRLARWSTGPRCGLTDELSAPCWSVRRIPTHGRLTPCGN
jgi:hypothetical protein